MKNINLLIKPASSGCNLKCKYCFYHDVSNNREIKNYGIMKDEILENLVKNVYSSVEESVNFAFQGGEPTFAGVDFFYKFHNFVEKYNTKNIKTTFSLQTNGTLLNKKWGELFKKFNYLIGVSLDGNKEVHNKFRVDDKGEGTFSSVLRGINILKKYEVDFNILCVVNKFTAENGKAIYNFFRKSGFRYYQFIPCLDKLKDFSDKDYTLSAKDYGKFLDEIFELWYQDIFSGKNISIRNFDNYIKILLGEEPEACDMVGHCNMNAVVEADGSVYPCDFYVLDEYRIGNLNEKSFEEILLGQKERQFLESSLFIQDSCKICEYFRICRGGCRRHKESENGIYQNKFCESYKYFFQKNLRKMLHIANCIKNS